MNLEEFIKTAEERVEIFDKINKTAGNAEKKKNESKNSLKNIEQIPREQRLASYFDNIVLTKLLSNSNYKSGFFCTYLLPSDLPEFEKELKIEDVIDILPSEIRARKYANSSDGYIYYVDLSFENLNNLSIRLKEKQSKTKIIDKIV